MIRKSIAFVLGAGASFPYGFPTGEGLVNEVIGLTNRDRTLDAFLYNDCTDSDVKRFARDLANSDALSVDSFLEHRPDFLKIGKLAIALCLIPKEQDEFLSRQHRQSSPLGRMAWYHYLWNEMASPKGQFGRNNVSFITFNYDRSLERYLFLRLKAKHQYASDEECFAELEGLSFIHLYGSLGDERFVEDPFDRLEPSILEVNRAANRLKIIYEEATAQNFSQAFEHISNAGVICFLGYGFHALNNERLSLREIANVEDFKGKKWFTTRYGMTDEEFRRRTRGFHTRFTQDQFGYANIRHGSTHDGALELLRSFEVIG